MVYQTEGLQGLREAQSQKATSDLRTLRFPEQADGEISQHRGVTVECSLQQARTVRTLPDIMGQCRKFVLNNTLLTFWEFRIDLESSLGAV